LLGQVVWANTQKNNDLIVEIEVKFMERPTAKKRAIALILIEFSLPLLLGTFIHPNLELSTSTGLVMWQINQVIRSKRDRS
jgi:hypothetical protein